MSGQKLPKKPSKTLGMPTFMAPPSVSEALIVDPPETPVVMTMYVIRQKIDVEIHDVKYQVSQQLDYIVEFVFIMRFNKPMS